MKLWNLSSCMFWPFVGHWRSFYICLLFNCTRPVPQPKARQRMSHSKRTKSASCTSIRFCRRSSLTITPVSISAHQGLHLWCFSLRVSLDLAASKGNAWIISQSNCSLLLLLCHWYDLCSAAPQLLNLHSVPARLAERCMVDGIFLRLVLHI